MSKEKYVILKLKVAQIMLIKQIKNVLFVLRQQIIIYQEKVITYIIVTQTILTHISAFQNVPTLILIIMKILAINHPLILHQKLVYQQIVSKGFTIQINMSFLVLLIIMSLILFVIMLVVLRIHKLTVLEPRVNVLVNINIMKKVQMKSFVLIKMIHVLLIKNISQIENVMSINVATI